MTIDGMLDLAELMELDLMDMTYDGSDLNPAIPDTAKHKKQHEFVTSLATRRVLVTGRRGGKTQGEATIAAQGLAEGKRVLYATPKADQFERFWYAVRSWFADDIDSGRLYKNESKHLIEPYGVDENGPRIRAKTAHNAETMRGDTGDIIILDEYQDMNPDIDTVVLPMALDTGATIIYAGTPKRKNHFYIKYMTARSDESGRWAYWHFSSHDNPFLDKKTLEEISMDMTDDDYRQEIMAEFLDNDGAVFRNIANCIKAPVNSSPEDHAGHSLVVGVDWAKHSDYTSISVICLDCACEVALDRFNQIDYYIQRDRIKWLCDRWAVDAVLPERNSIGEPNIEQLILDGLPIENGPDGNPGFNTTASTKPRLIRSLALALEREEYQFLPIKIATAELESYEQKVSMSSGRSQYSAPSGLNDDTVISRALAVWLGNSVMPAFL